MLLIINSVSAQTRDAEFISSLVSFNPEQNLLASENGAIVTRTPSNYGIAQLLNDSSPVTSWYSTRKIPVGQVADLVFKLPREQRLGSLLIQTYSDRPNATTPREVEVLLARTLETTVYTPAGKFILSPMAGWHRMTFNPHEVTLIKLRIRSTYSADIVALGEVAGFAPGVDVIAGRYSYPPHSFPIVAPAKKVQEMARNRQNDPPTVAPPPASVAQSKPEPKKPAGPRKIRGIPEVVNTGLLRINGEMIPLYGIRGAYQPHADKFAQFIRDREVSCEQDKNKTYHCLLEGRDVSEAVLSNGAGWAVDGADDALKAIEASARQAQKGVWQ